MHNKKYTDSEISFLLANVDKYGTFVCAEKINRSPISVQQKYYRLTGRINSTCYASKEEVENLKFDEKISNLELNFSKTEHPKELAYFLGYFWADGYINKRNWLYIEVISYDANKLISILDKLRVYYKIYRRKRKGRKEQTTIFISNSECGKKLKELGKYSFSKENHEKILNFIPEEYHIYFIRGLIDGDGNFYLNNKKYEESGIIKIHFTIASRFKQDWSFLIDEFKKFGLNSVRSIDRIFKTSKGSYLLCTKNRDILNFIENVYLSFDDEIYLERKGEIIKNIKKILNEKNISYT